MYFVTVKFDLHTVAYWRGANDASILRHSAPKLCTPQDKFLGTPLFAHCIDISPVTLTEF